MHTLGQRSVAVIAAFTFALALVLLYSATASGAESGRFTMRGTVMRVIDGDTIQVHLASGKSERVRLVGIDTPELSPLGCFGRQAKVRASQLAQGKHVQLVGDATQDTRDRYRRLLAYVILPGRRDLGRQLIAEGFGTVYAYRRAFVRLPTYQAAQGSARGATRGLWRALSNHPAAAGASSTTSAATTTTTATATAATTANRRLSRQLSDRLHPASAARPRLR